MYCSADGQIQFMVEIEPIWQSGQCVMVGFVLKSVALFLKSDLCRFKLPGTLVKRLGQCFQLISGAQWGATAMLAVFDPAIELDDRCCHALPDPRSQYRGYQCQHDADTDESGQCRHDDRFEMRFGDAGFEPQAQLLQQGRFRSRLSQAADVVLLLIMPECQDWRVFCVESQESLVFSEGVLLNEFAQIEGCHQCVLCGGVKFYRCNDRHLSVGGVVVQRDFTHRQSGSEFG